MLFILYTNVFAILKRADMLMDKQFGLILSQKKSVYHILSDDAIDKSFRSKVIKHGIYIFPYARNN